MKNAISEELKKELSDLRARARLIEYKNAFPRLPKDQQTQKAFDNLMVGFNKRLANWKSGLLQIENPGGLSNGKDESKTEEKSGLIYKNGQFVSNSLADLANFS